MNKDKSQVQQEFDALIEKHGAEAVITAIKSHVHPYSDGTCPQVPCPKGYFCSGSQCYLDVGP